MVAWLLGYFLIPKDVDSLVRMTGVEEQQQISVCRCGVSYTWSARCIGREMGQSGRGERDQEGLTAN